GLVNLWEMDATQPPVELRGHVGIVKSLGFSSDGRRLASAGLDGAVVVWDTRDGQEALTLRRQLRGISGVAFSPDGRRLVAVGNDYLECKIWESDDLPQDEVARRLKDWRTSEAQGAESIRNWHAAIFQYDELLKNDPSEPDYLIGRGNCRAETADW